MFRKGGFSGLSLSQLKSYFHAKYGPSKMKNSVSLGAISLHNLGLLGRKMKELWPKYRLFCGGRGVGANRVKDIFQKWDIQG